ncbi:chemoreceptor glutamine deamidase/glutamate methylesterase CheD [Petrotoga sp. 9PWA.NaAc.5.4]|uniref:chemoreceptor glutamine deamidase/glutamate methylesterase CheD n=1 Tax=Petrotoga sp. 9PWA.NaAc.5.4 TaxID=1434328 RepID=UPI000CAECFEE|nr:chemoreceptor glutamine deamidase/glutamate methylesterase CheD [Petrotoga sp. 9PWA.NaAc.5.4]PNR97066.1 chemotaxis protein CheD [Petrotoga sp. 9PWA.NaAc.5.4]
MNKKIIGIGEYTVDKNPTVLVTLGLGSCVAVCIRDKEKLIGGMIHVMLPESRNNSNEKVGKYADSGIKKLVEELLKMGANVKTMEAKIAGGASMFKSSNSSLDIGNKNVTAIKKILEDYKIKLVSEDTSGSRARSVEYDIASGELKVKKVGGGEKVEVIVI